MRKIHIKRFRFFIKILCFRIGMIAGLLFISACESAGNSKYATDNAGPVSVRAQNALAGENPAGLVEVGQGFERAGNYAAALRVYAQAVAAAPDLLSAKLAFARVSIKTGNMESGLALLTDLLDKHPDRTDVRREITQAYLAQGNYKAASLFFAPILEVERIAPANLILAGKMAAVEGAFDKSRGFFEKAFQGARTNPIVLENIALSFALEEDYATAVALVQRSMDEPAGLISGKTVLATIYALSGQLQGAMQLARGAMTVEEANKRLIFYQILPRLNQREQAEAVYFNRIPKDTLDRLSGAASN